MTYALVATVWALGVGVLGATGAMYGRQGVAGDRIAGRISAACLSAWVVWLAVGIAVLAALAP